MTLPPFDHPIWKLLQTLASIVLLGILITHGLNGGHTSAGLDQEDLAGLLGLGVGGNLVRQLLSRS